MQPEPWLRGPIPGVLPALMPAAHALLQAREDIERVTAGLGTDALWARPSGVASVGFHLRHVTGSIDRLLTYARGAQLSQSQLAAIAAEREPGDPPAAVSSLVPAAVAAIDRALGVVRDTPASSLGEARAVGRAGLPSTVLGLLFHIAEHTQRHTGQIIATARVVRDATP